MFKRRSGFLSGRRLSAADTRANSQCRSTKRSGAASARIRDVENRATRARVGRLERHRNRTTRSRDQGRWAVIALRKVARVEAVQRPFFDVQRHLARVREVHLLRGARGANALRCERQARWRKRHDGPRSRKLDDFRLRGGAVNHCDQPGMRALYSRRKQSADLAFRSCRQRLSARATDLELTGALDRSN